MSLKFVIATGNQNKFRELEAIAAECGVEVVSASVVRKEKGLGAPPEVVEDGLTYLDNARLKAESYSQWASMPAIGDDSGLEVSILDNRPGLYSARYLGVDKTYPERMAALVAEIQQAEAEAGVSNREAFYRCALFASCPDGLEFQSEYRLRGEILDHPQGEGGFGYDPIVLMDKFGKTFAELEFSRTSREGFRAEAAKLLFAEINSRQ